MREITRRTCIVLLAVASACAGPVAAEIDITTQVMLLNGTNGAQTLRIAIATSGTTHQLTADVSDKGLRLLRSGRTTITLDNSPEGLGTGKGTACRAKEGCRPVEMVVSLTAFEFQAGGRINGTLSWTDPLAGAKLSMPFNARIEAATTASPGSR